MNKVSDSLLPMKIYEFRNFFLNSLERQVIKNGKRIELTPRTFDVLQLLVELYGKIVSKDEMLGTVWDGRFVEEGNLPVHVSKLRRLLNETETQRFIETVHGTGYRFISPVRSVSKDEWRKLSFENSYFVEQIRGGICWKLQYA